MTAYIEADRRALADEMRVLETKLRCYTSADMKRPKGLTLTAVLMVICSTMLLAAIDYTKAPHVLRQVTFLSIAICIGYVFVWFYWKGKDWARIAVLICSVGSIYNLRLWNRVSLSPAPSHNTKPYLSCSTGMSWRGSLMVVKYTPRT